jgi:ABC-type uncharacterized transport system permease subunit
VIAEILVKAAPLLFCALAFVLAWKAGVLNIGAEGQFLAGALACGAVATRTAVSGPLGIAAALAAGAAAGALWAGVAAWLRERRGVIDILSTILLNFVAAGVLSVAVHGFLQERSRAFPQSDPVPPGLRLPLLVPGTRLHAGVAIAVALALAIAAGLRATRAGFRLRAAGSGPEAAAYAGIPVAAVRVRAFLAAGAVAGLGGACELLGVAGRLFESFSPGYGYVGLAVAVVGVLSPIGAIASAAAFGALGWLGTLLQRRQGISSTTVSVLEGIILLAALAIPRIRARVSVRPAVRPQ